MAAVLPSENVCVQSAKADRSQIPSPQTFSEAVRSDERARFAKALKQVQARRLRLPQQDPDLAAVGSLIEGSKVYVLLAACVLCRALSVLLLKDAMKHLRVPNLMVFCHQVALVVIFCVLKWSGMIVFPRISMAQLQAAVPDAILEILEMVFFFSSLKKGSVFFVVTLTSVASAVLQPLASRCAVWGKSLDSSVGSRWSSRQLAALCVATSGTMIEFLTHRRPTGGTSSFIALWVVTRAAHSLWEALQDAPLSLLDARDSDTSGRIFYILPAEPLKKLLETAQAPQPPPAARALMRHGMACVPVLTLALGLQEGAEVMRHDVSVPLVTAVVLSAVLFAVAEGTRLTMRCSNTIAASLDGAFMLTLAAIVTLGDPGVKGLARGVGLVLVATGLLVLRRGTAGGAQQPGGEAARV